ncbi:hypothetical protein BSS2_I0950 [Brucella suis bv. 1 str. S2]|uniref:Uncharacterized protein n=7 Tax=Brucella TaxID=234 RepID=Q2YQ93_BRUA2|nr:hypothetical protein BR0973 [Brucella suis 1330]AAX74332.1 hypothetical protein BruAb1_0979 [Brucella abortus bv. 1 str. 9-941]ABX62043.1 Hypothetical protein, conserved [Brucella canis ATCC 23365]ABY38076.1 Hypothetical protein, conserved [Brucella suis ATCC 23445]ACO00758.1 Hypothetical protein, conserved [Brucella melitensis ATCC 23457]ACU47957.1 hypothetical protein BMI_I974 [Brucella microti CCM 4915]AEK54289.1 hypothetical protein BPI_I1012 [Brucella pinnipedialis B2/94]AEU05983.1 h
MMCFVNSFSAIDMMALNGALKYRRVLSTKPESAYRPSHSLDTMARCSLVIQQLSDLSPA